MPKGGRVRNFTVFDKGMVFKKAYLYLPSSDQIVAIAPPSDSLPAL